VEIMFSGDHPDLDQTRQRAVVLARHLGHPRVGSEHLLLALTGDPSPVADVLAACGATRSAIQTGVSDAAPAGAGAAADRDVLAPLWVDLARLWDVLGCTALDLTPTAEPVWPLGSRTARRRCRQIRPPIGLDAQAAYGASLRLALARRARAHRCEHLALALVTLDPGVAWVLATAGVDSRLLLTRLALTFPPPKRHALSSWERRLGQRIRQRGIVHRYQDLTGRTVASGHDLATLIAG
jgi:hypothetical protein